MRAPVARCVTCGSYPCGCRLADLERERPLRARPIRLPCVCGGPEIVADSGSPEDVMAGVQRHQIEPTHIAYDERSGIPLSEDQLRVRELDSVARELVGVA